MTAPELQRESERIGGLRCAAALRVLGALSRAKMIRAFSFPVSPERSRLRGWLEGTLAGLCELHLLRERQERRVRQALRIAAESPSKQSDGEAGGETAPEDQLVSERTGDGCVRGGTGQPIVRSAGALPSQTPACPWLAHCAEIRNGSGVGGGAGLREKIPGRQHRGKPQGLFTPSEGCDPVHVSLGVSLLQTVALLRAAGIFFFRAGGGLSRAPRRIGKGAPARPAWLPPPSYL